MEYVLHRIRIEEYQYGMIYKQISCGNGLLKASLNFRIPNSVLNKFEKVFSFQNRLNFTKVTSVRSSW